MDKGPVLLLVEDEPLIRTDLLGALEDGGYGLVEAEDGSTALEAIQNGQALSGVITDIRLSDGPNGWEVARQARHHFPNIAVVYMTGDSAADWTAEGVPNSVLLQKPFAYAQVITAISTLLNVADVSPAQVNPAADV
jgi:CheY-like chemotaxis protein